jgi:signal transduction histidine kinase
LSSQNNNQQARRFFLAGWLSQLLAMSTLVIAVVAVAVYAFLAVQWMTRPYLGVELSPDMVVIDSNSLLPEESAAYEIGLQEGDQLLAVGGQPLSDDYRLARREVASVMAAYAPGDSIRVRLQRDADAPPPTTNDMQCIASDGAQLCAAIYELSAFPLVDFAVQFGVSWVVAVVALVLAVLILRWRWESLLARLTAIAAGLLAIFSAGMFDFHTAQSVSLTLGVNMLVLIGGVLQMYVWMFPSAPGIVRRQPWLRLVSLALVLGGLVAVNVLLQSGQDPHIPLYISYAFAAVSAIGLFVGMLVRFNNAASPVVRDQCAIVIVSLLLASAPMLVWFISDLLDLAFLQQDLSFHFSLVTPFLLLLPGGVTYALAQDALPQSDTLISRSIVYTIMGIGVVLAYGLVVAGSALFTGSVIQASNPLVIAVTVFLTALIFVPARNMLEKRVNHAYFRTHREYQSRVETLAQELTQVDTLAGIVTAMRDHINDTLAPSHIFLFFPNAEANKYVAHGIPTPETDVRFDMKSPLVELLFRQQRPLHLDPDASLPPELASERARLAVLGAPVLVPLRGQETLGGFMVVGPRQVMERYHYDDLSFMQALADQAALAVERAQVVANLQRRVREMNVLGQVAQAVNFTAEFDDLLELIYTQTNRVIDAPNFYIALRDPYAEEMYYAFYSEDDERISEREGVRWRMGRDLLSEIVRGGQPMRVDNYGHEIVRRGVQSTLDNENLKAWIGVPLNGPSAAIGVMCVGSTALTVTYSDEQLKILWQIADQAATAIDKARLFQETQIRARQLTALNDISTQLATVFQDTDRLLDLITDSAVQILEAEAGSLLMIDTETQYLEFKVAVGSEAEELVGTKLPPGTGLVGTVADRGEPVIVNDTTRDPRWYSGVDHTTTFNTVTLMAAPLLGNAGVIGVLEVINKRDGGVFVEDDKRLLTAFAGQAAIAIENARLFQMTDQQLAARVDELDTMQKIDRELNETLKLQRVLDITLDWALRESGADAGALGMVDAEENLLRIMVHYGYDGNTPMVNEGRWPLDRGVVGRVVRSGQHELVADVSIDRDYVESLPGTYCQLTVPLFTGGEVSGVILLESTQSNAFSLMDLDFVSRLAEHASPAMANARLFAQLERANTSRSKFVSMVAHELKTPMTSIKGYADLLLGGVVGPMNEQQKNFVGTILFNVERMDTLVSDLNDVTKLQTDQMQLHKTPVDFHGIVEETLRPLRDQIAEKSQQIQLNMQDRLPDIYADKNRLIQVLTNLVTNAYKYTPEGGTITITAEPARNTWDPQGASQVLHCSVKDDGLGISEQDQDRLFTAYFRSTNDEALEQPGTGLGLVIVRGIVEQHGGQIWVDSKLGAGSTFHITVPLASAVPEAQERAVSA